MSTTPTATATRTVMTGRNLTVKLGGNIIIEDIDIDVYEGEILALVGPNGAGKSTLLGALTGDLELQGDGEVRLHGELLDDLTMGEQARMRAVQLQENRMAFAFTATEVVRLGRAAWAGTDEEERDDAVVYSVMEATDSSRLAQRSFPSLSGGEKARTTFARTLAQETSVLLLDEPTAAMDIRHQEAVLQQVRDRADAGASVVVVIHDLSVAAAYADRILLLKEGKHITTGTPREVLTSEIITEVYGHPVDVITHPETGELIVAPTRNRARIEAFRQQLAQNSNQDLSTTRERN